MRDVFAHSIVKLVAVFMIVASTPTISQKQETFGQAELEAFVTAAIRIERLIAERQPQIDKAETQEQANALADAAVDEIAAIIEDTPGISLPEYRVISKAVAKDPALHRRINNIARQQEMEPSRPFRERPSS